MRLADFATTWALAIRLHLPLNSIRIVAFFPMRPQVRAPIHNLKILRAVVCLVPVAVVHLLMGQKRTTKRSLSYYLVLIAFLAPFQKPNIAARVFPSHALIIRHAMLSV